MHIYIKRNSEGKRILKQKKGKILFQFSNIYICNEYIVVILKMTIIYSYNQTRSIDLKAYFLIIQLFAMRTSYCHIYILLICFHNFLY